MGDRANIVVLDWRESPTYLYTHWRGHQCPAILQEALASEAGRSRWSDNSYLTRIIFSRMIRDDVDGATGFGISASMGDNEYPHLVVDPNKREVRMVPEGALDTTLARWTFEEYIALDNISWDVLTAGQPAN